MVSTNSVYIFVASLAVISYFCIWCIKNKNSHLMHRLYLILSLAYVTWIIPLIIMHFADSGNLSLMFFLDCCTAPGGLLSPVLYLCIAISYVGDRDKMTKWMAALFIMPCISALVAFTNPLHHLQYEVFSTVKDQIVFGPYVVVSGIYSYGCLIMGMAVMIKFALQNKSRLYLGQSILFVMGGLVPLVVSSLASLTNFQLPITATPMSFVATIILNGIAIYHMHFLDIKPVAIEHVLDAIPDCYLVLSGTGLVISYNRQFESVFASKYGIWENKYLTDCINEYDISKQTAVYNMITAVESSKTSNTVVSYEQSMTVEIGSSVRKCYYVAEVSPLVVKDNTEGFVVIFKDITKVRESMKQLEDNKERMMEQDRLAFLGQMIGGLAHNLKTPIMGISGCISSEEALIEECEESFDDPVVTIDDYKEICKEAKDWLDKMKESVAYMSDIITAIKEQATNAIMDKNSIFNIEEVLKRCALLMRHELQAGKCQIKVECNEDKIISLNGDINNLVQVMNNLISNAIYAQKDTGNKDIIIKLERNEELLKIMIIDSGHGVAPGVRDKLFKAMVTNKGAMGTGLGLYISNAIIRGKFGGTMWVEDNPTGGSIFGIDIPMDKVTVTENIKREAI